MPRQSLRCSVEINAHAVTCPGVYLPRRDDVYLTICLFGQVRRTQLSSPIFPLIFHEKFKFDKVYYTAYQPSHVADALEDEPIIIELVQISDIYEGGKLLAYYETNARDFLYPYPSYSPTYGTQDRDILLERNLDFPGIAPRFEFSTQTIISEASSPTSVYDDDIVYIPKSGRVSRSRTRSPKKNTSISYGRPTVSSITRTRSVSPSVHRHMDQLNIDDTYEQQRPPFVVRKVNSPALTGRVPGTPSPKQKIRCMHGTYGNNTGTKKRRTVKRTKSIDYLDLYTDNLRPRRTMGYSSSDDLLYSDTESDLLDLTTTRYRSPSPVLRATSPVYRATSPLYRSSLTDRYLSPVRAERIKAEVDAAIELNRSKARLEELERLDRLYPYSSYRYRRTLDDLELDLELARRSRYPYLYY